MLAVFAVISAGSIASAGYPWRVRSYYAPVPVVRSYSYAYRAPYRTYYAPTYVAPRRSYYAPSVSYYAPSYHVPHTSYYAPAPVYAAPYGGVSVVAPGVSLRIGF